MISIVTLTTNIFLPRDLYNSFELIESVDLKIIFKSYDSNIAIARNCKRYNSWASVSNKNN